MSLPQAIQRLLGFALAHASPAELAQNRPIEAFFNLNVQQRVFNAQRRNQRQSARQPVLSERWIKEYHIKIDVLLGKLRQYLERIIGQRTYLRDARVLLLPMLQGIADVFNGGLVLVNQYHIARAAADAFEAKRATSGEHVQNLLLGKLPAPKMIEPVKHRFARTITGRALSLVRRHGQ